MRDGRERGGKALLATTLGNIVKVETVKVVKMYNEYGEREDCESV